MKKYKNLLRHKIYKGRFIIDEQELRRIEEVVKQCLIKDFIISYIVKFKNGTELETDDLEEILKEENAEEEKIISLEIKGKKKEGWDILINIDFNSFGYKDVNIRVEGNSKDWVFLAYSKLEDRIKKIEQPYSFLGKIDDFYRPLVILVLFFLIFFLIIFFISSFISEKILELLLVFGPLFIVWPLSMIINRIIEYLFPTFTFAIGKEEKRIKKIEELRSKIFWSLFVTFSLTIIASLLLKFIF